MSYIGRQLNNLSDRVKLDSITASATATYNLLLNTVAYVPSSAESLTVSLNGVIQAPQDSYTVSGSTITFASTLSASDSIDFILAERSITLQTPSAGSVGTSQLASDAVNGDKIADDSISDEHLDITAITGQTEKTSLADADKFLISDSADSGALKYVQKSNLPSGGLVLVGSVTDDSGSSVITLDNIFSSTYKSYLIQMTRLTPSSGGTNIEFLFRDSSSADLGANYGYASRTLRANDASESTRNGDGQSYVTITTAGISGVNSNTSGQGLRMSLFVADPYASEHTGYHGNFSILDNAGYGIAGYLGGIHQANSSVRGFKLRPSTGTITKATIRVYGLVDS